MNRFAQPEDPTPSHISEILTDWVIVERARRPSDQPDAREAQTRLLRRYERAIRAYLWSAVKDVHRVEDLFQKLCLRLAEGKLESADPALGRFRHYLKSILYRLVIDDHRDRRKRKAVGEVESLQIADESDSLEHPDEHRFAILWREEILEQTWRDLEEYERAFGKPYFSVLRLRSRFQESRNREIAAQLSEQVGREFTEARVGSLLHEAREKFAERVIENITQTLRDPTTDAIEDEIIALNLHRHNSIRRVLRRRLEPRV